MAEQKLSDTDTLVRSEASPLHPGGVSGPDRFAVCLPVVTKWERGVTETEAAAVYRAGYWTAAGCEGLPAGLDLMVFDAAVNQGPSRARRFAGEATDGPVWRRIEAVRRLREAHYRSLSSFPVFGRGWLRRLTAVAETARRMAEQALSPPAALQPTPAPPIPGVEAQSAGTTNENEASQ
jgi:lysozyme family protein